MPVCGSVGRWGEPLWELNGLPWEHFVENQCGGRGDRDRRPDLVGRREGRGGGATDRMLNFVACLEFAIRQ